MNEALVTQRGTGFVCVNDGSGLVVIPSGFCIITLALGEEGTRGIRWSLSSDAQDDARVKYVLGNMVRMFPVFTESKLHTPFLSFISSSDI